MSNCTDCNGITVLPGQDGNGIVSITDNGDGTLTILYTNGNTYVTPDFSSGALPLSWQTLPLVNGWTSVSGHTAQYAISSGGDLLYLRGRISQATAGGDTFNTSINFGRVFTTMCYLGSGSIALVVCNNGVSFTGLQCNVTPTDTIYLDTIPVIRLEI
jgi:hypothetical protein